MDIKQADYKQLDEILTIYAQARKFMQENGNPNQWKNNKPNKETLINDINNNNLYIIEENEKIYAVFALCFGNDPTYSEIYEGNWLSELPYGTIHRVASNGQIHGIFDTIVDFCFQKINHLRIDTHKDNKIMQHLIEKNNFQKCGIIYLADGTPRLAYEKI